MKTKRYMFRPAWFLRSTRVHRFPSMVAMVLTLLLAAQAAAQDWPSDSDWVPLTAGGDPYGDGCNDTSGANNEKDIVGNLDYPAVYYYFSMPAGGGPPDYLFVRIRLDGDPSGLRPFGWAVGIDTDGDYTNYEYLIMVNGIANPDEISVLKNSERTGTFSLKDEANIELDSFLFSDNGRTLMAPADSQLCGDPDYFLDVAIPLSLFYADGAALTKPWTIFVGSSANANNINADVGNHDGSSNTDPLLDAVVSDAIGPDSTEQDTDGDGLEDHEDNCPSISNPKQTDSDKDGSGDECDLCVGDDANGDTDGDGVCNSSDICDGLDNKDKTDSDSDGVCDAKETAIGTDPNDADSDDDGVKDGDEPLYTQDTDKDGLINALDPDSDNDGLYDGTEMGITEADRDPATDITKNHFIPDADPQTTTDPLDADTDKGGITDGAEDINLNGAVDEDELDPNDRADDDTPPKDTDNDGLPDELEKHLGTKYDDADSDDDGVPDGDEPNFADDTDGDGLINARDPDSDNDGLYDGTELGITEEDLGEDTDLTKNHFRPDADNTTTTNPLLPDTDNGGVSDGNEDVNLNGAVDNDETDPNDGRDDSSITDTDNDGLSDALENEIGTSPNDADTDNDGVPDGDELNFADDTDGDGYINANDPDSDGDGILDGTEMGITEQDITDDTDTTAGNFIPDADPSTTTSPIDPDTDHGGLKDGEEDLNANGKIDPGETDPNDMTDDFPEDPDGDGIVGIYSATGSGARFNCAVVAPGEQKSGTENLSLLLVMVGFGLMVIQTSKRSGTKTRSR